MAHFTLLLLTLLPFVIMTSAAGPCACGWYLFGDHCYQMQPTLADWDVAKQTCLDLGSELLVVSSIEEDSFVSSLTCPASFSRDKKTWVNCNNRGRAVDDWVCGEDSHTMTYSNWRTGEPNGNGNEYCAEIHYATTENGWNDKECNAPRIVICEKRADPCTWGWSLFGDHCYQMQPTLADWDLAKHTCLDLGSELLVVSSIEEDSFVSSLTSTASFSRDKKTWVNCNNRGRALDDWVCGEDSHTMTYSDWRTGEPNGDGNEYCAEIHYATTEHGWNDKECNAPRIVICEKRAAPLFV